MQSHPFIMQLTMFICLQGHLPVFVARISLSNYRTSLKFKFLDTMSNSTPEDNLIMKSHRAAGSPKGGFHGIPFRSATSQVVPLTCQQL